MKKLLIIITILSVISCKNTETKSELKKEENLKELVKKTEKEEQRHSESETVLLNNGKRWIANPETTDGIKKMLLIIKSFPTESNTEDYITLNKDLETEFTTIFQKCTMKGESHEQLHNFLKPMIVLFDNLKSTDKEVRTESLNHLKKHLSTYKNYFE